MGTWTLDEEVVLVYYVTRNITYASIIEIIALRCGTGVRTINQITQKVKQLRKNGILEQKYQPFYRRNRDQHWNIKRADRWILLSMGKAGLDILLDFSGYIAAIIDESNDLGRFLSIMHMADGEKAYFPSRFNVYYEYQSLHHFDNLYQPANTGGMDRSEAHWPSQFNQHHEMPRLSPPQSSYQPNHLYQPDSIAGMDTSEAHWPSQFNQHYESQPHQSVCDLDRLYQRHVNQHYELPDLSPLAPSHWQRGHLDQ